jgi:hypothetical protein
MNLEDYSRKLRPFAGCKNELVEIVGNKYVGGARCNSCGNFLSFTDPDSRLKRFSKDEIIIAEIK